MTTGGVGLLPAYANNFLTRSVTSRLLKGETPTVELVNRLQEVERVSHPQAFAFETGRVGHSCLEEGELKLSYELQVSQGCRNLPSEVLAE
jgi:hypothetical protein